MTDRDSLSQPRPVPRWTNAAGAAAPTDVPAASRDDPAPRSIHYLFLAAGFTAFAIYGSLIPLNYTPLSWGQTLERFLQLPLLDLGLQSRTDWLQNILLFMPIGFFALAALTVDRGGRAWRAACVAIVLPACGLLSVAIEFSQFWFPPRTVSQNDIAAEMIGAALGAGTWLWIGAAMTARLRSVMAARQSEKGMDWLLHGYCWGLFCYSVMPLDITIRPAEVWHKSKQGRLHLVPFWNMGEGWEFLSGLLITAVLFVPVGVLVATAFTNPSRPLRSVKHCVMLGMLIAIGIEACQVFVFSQTTDTTDIISGTLGVALGAAGLHLWQANERRQFARSI